jgi:hypothetical protein
MVDGTGYAILITKNARYFFRQGLKDGETPRLNGALPSWVLLLSLHVFASSMQANTQRDILLEPWTPGVKVPKTLSRLSAVAQRAEVETLSQAL